MTQPQLKIIKTLAELETLKNYLAPFDFIAYDTETTGLEKESNVVGVSVCAEFGVAYYVVLSYWDVTLGRLVDLETMSGIKAFLECLKVKSLIAHNGGFDCWMTANNFGVELIDSLHTDTMVLAHLLDESRPKGLKDLGVVIYGEDAAKEQVAMKASVLTNGGQLTKECFELFKADSDLLGYYGAKDALLTFKLFYHFVPQLYEQQLDRFFYEEESMPLLRGPTYQLNTTGLRVDANALQNLRSTLEAECLEARAFIYSEISTIVQAEYPGTSKTKTFNIGASQQLAWLLHGKLENDFTLLTDGGKELCRELGWKLPYTAQARRQFLRDVISMEGQVYMPAQINPKTKKLGRPKKVKKPWAYIQCGGKTLPGPLATKYKWVAKWLEWTKNQKILTTYVEGIQERMRYNVIRPSFNQTGTPSGRYSSNSPNFQNLPAREKSGQRVKACIVSRPGRVFVGADFSQIEPRVFASLSGDKRLMDCFASGEDFYSVVGAPVFGEYGCSLIKDEEGSFAKKHPKLRALTKEFALATVYGTTAPKMVASFKDKAGVEKSIDEAQEIIDDYLEQYPLVHRFMLDTHEAVKRDGFIKSEFGRPRRLPDAKNINEIYGKAAHAKLPYEARQPLNLSVNFRCQSTAASIINRSAIRFLQLVKEAELVDCRLVLNVHDELVVECREEDAPVVVELLKYSMEHTCQLSGGVLLEAKPVIARNLRDLK